MLTWEDVDVGDRFGPIQYTITDEIVDRFCAATSANHPWYTSPEESPYPNRIAPSTLPTGDDFLLIGVEMDTGVHARHSLRMHGPLLVGERVNSEGIIRDKYTKKRHRFLVMEYTLSTVDENRPLQTNVITYALPMEE